MSYCRWSSDQFQCDVYVYEDCNGGWTTHVAGMRSVELSPKMPWRWLKVPIIGALMWRRYTRLSKHWSETRTLVEIGLPHDGESFNDHCPICCADRLVELRDMGYNVPQYAIDSLMAESEDEGEYCEPKT